MKTVGIIGAGAAGLSAIRHCLANGLSPVAWEHGPSVGGTWNYTEMVDNDDLSYPVYSSMYSNLRTNLPKEIMAFPDLKFPKEEESFVHHTSVLKYLQYYSQTFNLAPYINFNHHVNLVEPVFTEDAAKPSWKLTTENLKTGEISNKTCDFLIVCNGHYSKPRNTNIIGIDKFAGTQLHSHSYRRPAGYGGKTIAVLGAGPSGIDIALELCTVAAQVYICHNLPIPIPCKLPDNLIQRKGIVEAAEDGFILKDRSFIEADTLLYCTGYEYDFPFLSPECKIRVENNQVLPLYKHVLNVEYPTMGFPGLVYQVLPFPIIDVQVRFLLSMYSGKTAMPTRDHMKADSERTLMRFQYEGNSARKDFHFFTRQMAYMRLLLDTVHQQHLPPFYEKMFNIVILRGIFGFPTLKEFRYTVDSKHAIKETFRGTVVSTYWKLPLKVISRMTYLFTTNFHDVVSLVCSLLYNRLKVGVWDCLAKVGLWDNYR